MSKFFLIQKYLDGKTSPTEEQQLLNWVGESEKNKQQYINQITSWNNFQGSKKLTKSIDAFNTLNKRLNITSEKKKKTYGFQTFLKYAAVFIIAVPSLYFFYKTVHAETPLKQKMVSIPVIEEGSDLIVLTREDGTENIISEEEEQLTYLETTTASEKLSYNTLTIPRGRVFRIILSDGTKVWLNAESKIRFPEKFLASEGTRTVYLEGEAFFDVSHNKDQPFIVKSGKLDVTVLGTQFNISSYPSEENISTTLVEGSVEVNAHNRESQPVLLKPNFQANYEKSTLKNTIAKVNAADFTAWIDRRILFKNETFENITNKIERTYDVNITNELENFDRVRFTGEFDIETIEEILKAMSEISDFNYKINGRNITIY